MRLYEDCEDEHRSHLGEATDFDLGHPPILLAQQEISSIRLRIISYAE